MAKWEYMIIYVESMVVDMEEELDLWGLQGWELVSVNGQRAYMKRQKAEEIMEGVCDGQMAKAGKRICKSTWL